MAQLSDAPGQNSSSGQGQTNAPPPNSGSDQGSSANNAGQSGSTQNAGDGNPPTDVSGAPPGGNGTGSSLLNGDTGSGVLTGIAGNGNGGGLIDGNTGSGLLNGDTGSGLLNGLNGGAGSGLLNGGIGSGLLNGGNGSGLLNGSGGSVSGIAGTGSGLLNGGTGSGLVNGAGGTGAGLINGVTGSDPVTGATDDAGSLAGQATSDAGVSGANSGGILSGILSTASGLLGSILGTTSGLANTAGSQGTGIGNDVAQDASQDASGLAGNVAADGNGIAAVAPVAVNDVVGDTSPLVSGVAAHTGLADTGLAGLDPVSTLGNPSGAVSTVANTANGLTGGSGLGSGVEQTAANALGDANPSAVAGDVQGAAASVTNALGGGNGSGEHMVSVGAGAPGSEPIADTGVLTGSDSQSPIGLNVGSGPNIVSANALPNTDPSQPLAGGLAGLANVGSGSGDHLVTGAAGAAGGTPLADAGVLTTPDSQSPLGAEIGSGPNVATADLLGNSDALQNGTAALQGITGTSGSGDHLATGNAGAADGTPVVDAGVLTTPDSQTPVGADVANGSNIAGVDALPNGIGAQDLTGIGSSGDSLIAGNVGAAGGTPVADAGILTTPDSQSPVGADIVSGPNIATADLLGNSDALQNGTAALQGITGTSGSGDHLATGNAGAAGGTPVVDAGVLTTPDSQTPIGAEVANGPNIAGVGALPNGIGAQDLAGIGSSGDNLIAGNVGAAGGTPVADAGILTTPDSQSPVGADVVSGPNIATADLLGDSDVLQNGTAALQGITGTSGSGDHLVSGDAGAAGGSPVADVGVLTTPDAQSPINADIANGTNLADAGALPNGVGTQDLTGIGTAGDHLVTGDGGASGGTPVADAGILTIPDSQSPVVADVGNGPNIANADLLGSSDVLQDGAAAVQGLTGTNGSADHLVSGDAGATDASPLADVGVLTNPDSASPVTVDAGNGTNLLSAGTLQNGVDATDITGNDSGDHLVTGDAGAASGTPLTDAGVLTTPDSQSPVNAEIGNGENIANATALGSSDLLQNGIGVAQGITGMNGTADQVVTGSAGENGGSPIADAGVLTTPDSQTPVNADALNGANVAAANLLSNSDVLSFPNMGGAGADALTGAVPSTINVANVASESSTAAPSGQSLVDLHTDGSTPVQIHDNSTSTAGINHHAIV